MMRIIQNTWNGAEQLDFNHSQASTVGTQLVLGFGGKSVLMSEGLHERLQTAFPNAEILICSTAGEIIGTEVADETLSLTAIEFEKTRVRSAKRTLGPSLDRRAAGQAIAESLAADDLAMVFVLSDGQNANGSNLVAGFNAVFEGRVPVMGGLAGDGASFTSTLVGLNGAPEQDLVAAIGLYGHSLKVDFGSLGGWEPFGPERLVTSAKENVVFQVDGQSALELYKRYLGERAADLPSSGLLFPLKVTPAKGGPSTVRTLLAVNEDDKSLTFAGDIPQGSLVRLMRAGTDKLLDGARAAAIACRAPGTDAPSLAILVSCVGRKLVMNQRVEEEVEQVKEVLGDAVLCGFYSYGELSPTGNDGRCELHNQTMTITTLSEL